MSCSISSNLSASEGSGDMKYLVVTGGTLSGLGKGTTISSIGVVLRSLGYRVTAVKIDPYLNIDAGTMSPYEHGEVYVLDDGGEVDLDLGNYERFLDVKLTRDHNITTGKIYDRVIRFEREGRYLGKTVQMVPHVTNAIKAWIQHISKLPVDALPGAPDVCLIEVGGTVGDIESGVYLEALQQFSCIVGHDNFCLCHVSFVPVMGTVGEQKTKPTQHSVRELRKAGLRPDFIFGRSEQALCEATKAKIALFSQVPAEHVISVHDTSNVYRMPSIIAAQGFGDLICKRLSLPLKPPSQPLYLSLARPWDVKPTNNSETVLPTGTATGTDTKVGDSAAVCIQCTDILKIWNYLADRVDNTNGEVKIGLVGKYTGLMDSYLSVMKALRHAAIEVGCSLEILFVESSALEEESKEDDLKSYLEAWATLKKVDGVLCPGGFGDRGILGKALSARYCRHSKTPYLGICLGMQTAVIDMCRELGYNDANSEEFDETADNKVVIFMPEGDQTKMGGTMRLGTRDTFIRDKASLASKLYDHAGCIAERHRHRYEVNTKYVEPLAAAGFKFVGSEATQSRMEIAELDHHPFFLCTQYHPEFTSRPLRPNPCFLGLLLASMGKLEQRLEEGGGMLRAGLYAKDITKA